MRQTNWGSACDMTHERHVSEILWLHPAEDLRLRYKMEAILRSQKCPARKWSARTIYNFRVPDLALNLSYMTPLLLLLLLLALQWTKMDGETS